MASKRTTKAKAKRFMRGVGSVLDVYPKTPVRVRVMKARPYQDDMEALRADSRRVGSDMWKAVKTLGRE